MTVQPEIMDARAMEHSNLGDVDRRNIAVMVSMAGFIFSIGFICWASISQFVDPASPAAMYAQGWATQGLRQGQEHRAKNLGWGLCWLLIGTCYMTLVQLVIRTVVIGRHLNLVDFIAVKGSIAVAIFEASMQLSIGMVAGAAIAGPPSPEGFIWDLAGFFLFSVLSFVLMVIFTFLFDIYTHNWSTWGELKKGNEAAAISSGVQIVCSAMLMSNAVSKSCHKDRAVLMIRSDKRYLHLTLCTVLSAVPSRPSPTPLARIAAVAHRTQQKLHVCSDIAWDIHVRIARGVSGGRRCMRDYQ